MEACITKKAITAESAATSFSFFAIPIATPMEKISGRFAKIMFPAEFMISRISLIVVPGPIASYKP